MREEAAKIGGDFSMSSLFEDLKEGLEEAIAYEKGYGAGRVKHI